MPKLIDLTGQKFGRWTVLERAFNGKREVYWLCQCDCGTIKQVKAASLRSGRSTSCGCYHAEMSKDICKKIGEKNIKSLVGQKFGEWTVLADSGKRRQNGGIIWTCQCSCGTIKDLEGRYLLEGTSTNCGCKRIISKGQFKINNLLTENNISFEKEKTFESCILPDSNKKAKFDFYVNNQYLIEYDGQQHFIETSSQNSYYTPEKILKIKEHDQFKNNWCKTNGIPLIRIPYTKYNTLELKDLLLESSDFIV